MLEMRSDWPGGGDGGIGKSGSDEFVAMMELLVAKR